jgi:hypothetical protein
MLLQQASAGVTDTDSMRGKLLHALQGLAAGGGWGGGVASGAGAGSGVASVLRQTDLSSVLRQTDLSSVLRQTDLAQVLRQLEGQPSGASAAEMTGVGSLSSLLHPSPSLHALQPGGAPTEGPGGMTASLWNTLSQQMGIESRVGGVGGLGGLGGVGMSCGLDPVSAELHDVQAQVHEALSLSQRQQLQQHQVTELQQHLAHMMQHNTSKIQLAALANRCASPLYSLPVLLSSSSLSASPLHWGVTQLARGAWPELAMLTMHHQGSCLLLDLRAQCASRGGESAAGS